MRLKKLTLTAVLTAAALVMFVLESQLPPLTVIPGIKPGLSNIFTLFAMEALGPGWAFGLFLTRVTLGCVITGQAIGMAAAMAPEDVHSLDVPALQARLLAIGAVLYPEGTETRKEEHE